MPKARCIRTLIIEVGAREMSAKGYFGVSLRRIAQEAGVHPRTVSHHFGSRRDLIAAIEAHGAALQGTGTGGEGADRE
jgi:AcrR family transcriptional regulator